VAAACVVSAAGALVEPEAFSGAGCAWATSLVATSLVAVTLALAAAGWPVEGVVWAKEAKLQATSPTIVKMHSFRFIDFK
jgi:hypothetical protein